MRKAGKIAAFCAFLASVSACSLFVSLDGLSAGSDAGAGDASFSDAPTQSDGGAGDAAMASDGSLGPDANFLDDFNRPDADLLGNDWVEKRPSVFSLSQDAVLRSVNDSVDYPDNMVYRPPNENIGDVQISMELTFAANVAGFPQIHARIQTNTVDVAGMVDSYLLYINVGSPTVAMISRTRGAENLSDLGTVNLSETMTAGERYRLTLQVAGANPVHLIGTVEHFESGAWTSIGTTAIIDTDPTQLADAGSTGFSASAADSDRYQYDNFTRSPL